MCWVTLDNIFHCIRNTLGAKMVATIIKGAVLKNESFVFSFHPHHLCSFLNSWIWSWSRTLRTLWRRSTWRREKKAWLVQWTNFSKRYGLEMGNFNGQKKQVTKIVWIKEYAITNRGMLLPWFGEWGLWHLSTSRSICPPGGAGFLEWRCSALTRHIWWPTLLF